MNNLRVRMHLKSGKSLVLTSSGYYEGQFKDWCLRNFVRSDGSLFGTVVMGEVFVNISQIEYIEEVKS